MVSAIRFEDEENESLVLLIGLFSCSVLGTSSHAISQLTKTESRNRYDQAVRQARGVSRHSLHQPMSGLEHYICTPVDVEIVGRMTMTYLQGEKSSNC